MLKTKNTKKKSKLVFNRKRNEYSDQRNEQQLLQDRRLDFRASVRYL